jgi:hypothetical protein
VTVPSIDPSIVAPILGHHVEMTEPCKCGSRVTMIGAGKAQHNAALLCQGCGKFNRRLSGQAAIALVDGSIAITKAFGKPPTASFKDIREYIAASSSANAAVPLNRAQCRRTEDVNNTVTENDLDEMYGSSYFNGSDFPKSKALELTVTKVEKREFNQKDGGKERKAVLSFKEAEKTLPLNGANYRTLVEEWGRDPAKWVGIKLMLYGEQTTMGRGVRLRSAIPDDIDGPAT